MPNVAAPKPKRRRRIQKNLKVEFCGPNGTCMGVSENFSINGLSIMTDNILALQSVVSITVHLPDGSISKLIGRVRRFLEISNDTAATSGEMFKGGMGIEIMKRDSSYIKFFMSLLSECYNRF